MPKIMFEDYGEDKFGPAIQSSLNSSKNILSGIFEHLSFNEAAVNFAGMNQDGIDSLRQTLKDYVNNAIEILNSFSPDTALDSGLKGPALSAAQIFFSAVRQAMESYISVLRLQVQELEHAADQFGRASLGINNEVAESADFIRRTADGIKIDEGTRVNVDNGH